MEKTFNFSLGLFVAGMFAFGGCSLGNPNGYASSASAESAASKKTGAKEMPRISLTELPDVDFWNVRGHLEKNGKLAVDYYNNYNDRVIRIVYPLIYKDYADEARKEIAGYFVGLPFLFAEDENGDNYFSFGEFKRVYNPTLKNEN